MRSNAFVILFHTYLSLSIFVVIYSFIVFKEQKRQFELLQGTFLQNFVEFSLENFFSSFRFYFLNETLKTHLDDRLPQKILIDIGELEEDPLFLVTLHYYLFLCFEKIPFKRLVMLRSKVLRSKRRRDVQVDKNKVGHLGQVRRYPFGRQKLNRILRTR